MEESRNNSNIMSGLKYIFVLVGIAAIGIAYFLGFSGYSAEADDLKAEIDDLKGQYKALQEKSEKYNEKDVKAYVAECDAEYEKVMKEFDGGISYQSQIMDTYNMANKLDIKIPSLTMSEPVGVEDTAREDIVFLTGQNLAEKVMTYQINTKTTYDKMKDVLAYVLEFEGKRKVPNSISLNYDITAQELSIAFSISEYAIEGEDRKVSEIEMPSYEQGSVNIFYNNEVVSRNGGQ